MKIHLALFFLLSFGANAQVIIYRCGNEYRNDLTVEEAKTCKRISPANPDPLKWELTSLSEASKFYLEKKAAIRDEQFLKKWALIVYSQAQRTLRNEEYRSAKNLYIFDCKKRSLGTRQVITYADSAGEGTIVETTSRNMNEVMMEDPVPDSIGESLIANVCGKRK